MLKRMQCDCRQDQHVILPAPLVIVRETLGTSNVSWLPFVFDRKMSLYLASPTGRPSSETSFQKSAKDLGQGRLTASVSSLKGGLCWRPYRHVPTADRAGCYQQHRLMLHRNSPVPPAPPRLQSTAYALR